jgi:Beta-propeller repeat/Abnormal spindle-like microcephaly-assoc'd, ASPM-SPD-2-Hydin
MRRSNKIGLTLAVTVLVLAVATHAIGERRVIKLLGGSKVRPAEHVPGNAGLRTMEGGRRALANSQFDPVLVYSTLLGPSQSGSAASAAFVDGTGNVYVAGVGFPVTPGVVEPNCGNNCTGSLAKIDHTGQSLAFSTNIDGVNPAAIAVDSSGNIYVAGIVPCTCTPGAMPSPSSPILPIPPGVTPFQAMPKGTNLGILKYNSTGTMILGATYLGGSHIESIGGVAVDSDGNLYVVGTTSSNDFPTTQNALQSSLQGTNDGFITKLNSSLSALIYSTYLGNASTILGAVYPSPPVSGPVVAVDASKNAYVAGNAGPGFPTTAGAILGTCGPGISDSCPFVAKVNAAGSALLYATYLADSAAGATASTLAIDGSQNIYVGGMAGMGFPEVNALQPCGAGFLDPFVSEINSSGALTFSTCLGQSTYMGSTRLVADSLGNVDIVGSVSHALPLKNPIQTNPDFAPAPFVASIIPNSTPPALLFSSYIGSGNSGSEEVSTAGVGADSGGNIYVIGNTPLSSSTFPVYNALDPVMPPSSQGSTAAAFVMKIAPTDAAAAALAPGALSFPPQQVGTASSPRTITVFDLGSSALAVSNATVTGDFSIQNNCATVAPAGGTCAIQVTFTPTALGTRNGTLTITDSSAGSPRQVALTGQGGVASASLVPATLSFPDTPVNTTKALSITLSDPGTVDLPISKIQMTGSGVFSESNDCGTGIPAGRSCQINVTFAPTALGDNTASLVVTDGASNSPQTVSMSGKGVAGSLGLQFAPGSGTALMLTAGGQEVTTLDIGGAGIAGTAALTCSGAPAGATCSLSPSTVQVNATSPSTIGLTLNTTARSQLWPMALSPTSWLIGLMLVACLLFFKTASAYLSLRPRWRFVPVLVLPLALCGCGGGASPSTPSKGTSGTPAGSYTLVVTATSGSTSQSLNVPLTVQ